MKHRSYTDEIKKNFQEGEYVCLIGRVIAKRAMGKIMFLDLRDRGGTIQLIQKRDIYSEDLFSAIKMIRRGDIILVEGKTCFSETSEKSILVKSCTILRKCQRRDFTGYKRTKKRNRFKEKYIELSVNYDKFKYYADCSRIIFQIREELYDRGFLEFNTNVLQSRFEGGLARPFEIYLRARDRKVYLRPALEVRLKQLLASGYEKVFEIGSVFRNEGFNVMSSPEFIVLECYQSFGSYDRMMDLLEAIIKGTVLKIFGNPNEKRIRDLLGPWKRESFNRVLEKIIPKKIISSFEVDDLREILSIYGFTSDSLTEGQVVRKVLERIIIPRMVSPIYITEIPLLAFPLAKASLKDKKLSEGAILVIDKEFVGDVYTDENDPEVIRNRFKQIEKPINKRFIDLLSFGIPPSAGFGLGINRLLLVLRGNWEKDIRETFVFSPLE